MRICSRKHIESYCRLLGKLYYINPTPSAALELESSTRNGQVASSWVSTHFTQQLVLIKHCSLLYWWSKHCKWHKSKKAYRKFKTQSRIIIFITVRIYQQCPAKALKVEICMSHAEAPQMQQNTKQLITLTRRPTHSIS